MLCARPVHTQRRPWTLPNAIEGLTSLAMGEDWLGRRFARFVTDLPALPGDVRRAADRAMLDTVGAIIAGTAHDTVKAVAAAYPTGQGTATVCTGAMADAEFAALINGTAAHAWDIDDTSYTGIMHGSAVILPAVIAVAEELGASATQVRQAFVAGSEVAYTLADICSHGHYFRGWWSTATFGLVGATAAAGRLHALDETAMTHAIGLAAASASGGKAVFGTDGKPFLAGEAARRAVSFARAAKAGVTGPEDGFEGGRGFFALLNSGQSDPGQIQTLGRRWRLTDPGLLFKSSPVCSAAHATIEQMSELMRQSGSTAAQIAQVRVEVPELVHVSLVYPEPKTPQQAQFSLPYAIACAALFGRVRFEDLQRNAVNAEQKRCLMAKVRTMIAEDLPTNDMRAHFHESARVTLELNDGRIFEGFCGSAYGMPENPMDDSDLVAKFGAALTFAGIGPLDVKVTDFDPLETLAIAVRKSAEGIAMPQTDTLRHGQQCPDQPHSRKQVS